MSSGLHPFAPIPGLTPVGHIKSGGMGSVWRATEEASGERVAVKFLHQPTADYAQRFLREAKVLASLRHDAIVGYRGHGQASDGSLYLVMEWLDGSDLAELLRRGPMSIEHAMAVAKRVLEALEVAHRAGIIHRDVKPGNIVLRDGQPDRAMLVDFGIAHVADASLVLTRTGDSLGTPLYMAPEQLKGEPVDSAADLFGFGCVLYEMLTGEPPFAATTLPAVLARLLYEEPKPIEQGSRPWLAATVMGLLTKSPKERQASARAVLDALRDGELEVPSRELGRLGSEENTLATMLFALSIDHHADATAPAPHADLTRSSFVQAARRLGAHAVPIVGRGWLCGMEATHGATADAVAMAQLALALRALDPSWRLAIVTSRRRRSEEESISQAVDRAFLRVASAPPQRIDVDETTRALLGTRYRVDADEQGYALVSRRGRSGLEPIVGRKQELRLIRSAIEAAMDDHEASIVVLMGESGYGKSRILSEVEQQASDSGFMVLSMVSYPTYAEVAFHSLRGMLHELTIRYPAIRDRASAVMDWTALTGIQSGNPLQAAALRRRLFVELLRDCSQEGAVMLIDDAQWLDRPTRELVLGAMADLTDSRLSLVAASRPSDPWLTHVRRAIALTVGPLPAKATGELARTVNPGLSESVIGRIQAQAAGHPFYLRELAIAAAHSDAIPESVEAMLEDEIASLSATARRGLRAAAIAGDPLDEGLLAAVVGEGEAHLPWLKELVDENFLVRVSPRQLRFVHALVLDAAYGLTPDEERRLAHERAADFLASKDRFAAARISHHYERAGLRAKAGRWLVVAVQQMFAVGDASSVQAWAERGTRLGLDASDEAELLSLSAESLIWTGDLEQAGEKAGRAMAIASPGNAAWYRALSAAASAAQQRGDLARVASLVDALEHALDEAREEEALAAALRTLTHATFDGRLERAWELVDRIHGLRAGRFPRLDAHVAWVRGRVLSARSDLGGCYRWFGRAREAFQRNGDRWGASYATVATGWSLMQMGAYERAVDCFESAIGLANALHLDALAHLAEHNLGWALAGAGRLDEALEHETIALRAYEGQGGPRMLGMAGAYLSRIHLLRGEVEPALTQALKAYDRLKAFSGLVCLRDGVLVSALLAAGRLSQAHEVVEQGRAELVKGCAQEEGVGLFAAAELSVLVGLRRPNEAAQRAREAVAELEQQAANIEDSALAHSYRARVVEHATILAIASELRDGVRGGPIG